MCVASTWRSFMARGILIVQARKRKAGQGGGSGKVGAGSAAVVAAAARGPQGHGVGRSAGAATAGEDEGPQEAGSGQKRRKTAKAKAPKEYIPKIGSANYAFLIVLLEVRGPLAAVKACPVALHGLNRCMIVAIPSTWHG